MNRLSSPLRRKIALAAAAGGIRRRRGFVLVAVLVIIALLSMVVVSLLFRLNAEDTAAAAGAGAEQAWAAALSGVEETMRYLNACPAGSLDWQNNSRQFKDRFVADDGADQYYYTVFSAADPDDREEIRYGVEDEAAKLNLNVATETNLMRLSRLNSGLVQTLLDFMDADDKPNPEGAEQEYYDALPNPYAIRNGPLTTLEELLLVRGFTPRVLYGEDLNLNFRLDPNEDDEDQSLPPDNKDGKLDRGLRPYLTTVSYDVDEDKDRVYRTNINDPDDPLPKVDLPEALVRYIELLRTNKVTLAHAADLLEAKGKFKGPDNVEAEIESGVGKAELPLVLDLFSTTADIELPGLINVNTASAQVLATLPEIDEPLAESIVSARRGLNAEKRQTIAWLYTEGVLDAGLFKKLAPRLTARGCQFHFHVVGYGAVSGRYRVLEVMIDLAPGKPAITYLRDLTRLGLPFAIETGRDFRGN